MTDPHAGSGHSAPGAPLPADVAVNARAWNGIAACADSALASIGDTPLGRLPDRLEWTPWPGRGPGTELFGDITGRRVAELGCGPGDHAAYLAAHGAAHVHGIDSAADRITAARTRWPRITGITWLLGDAADVLGRLPRPLDVCYSVFGALYYTAPDRLLPRIRARLVPGGRLVFSVTELRTGHLQGARIDNVSLPGGQRMPVIYYAHDAATWHTLLRHHGFTGINVTPIPAPAAGRPATLIIAAHRPARTYD